MFPFTFVPSISTQANIGIGNFSVDSLTKDLSVGAVDKPAWPLSTYGPAKNEPNLLGGLYESPEEFRVRAVTTLRAGSANEYMTYEAGKISAAEAVYNNARTNLQQAFEVASKQSSHAHLYAAAPPTSSPSSSNRPSPFASSSSTFEGTKSAFGQSTFTQTGFGTTATTTSPFGQPPTTTGAFGQPVAQPTSAFGSTFGQTPQPQSSVIKPGTGAFSSFGSGAQAPTTNPATNTATTGGATFDQPSFSTTSAFGALAQQQRQPAPPGFGTFALAPVTPASAFGQQAQPFGAVNTQLQPSAFSAFSAPTSSSTTTTSVFGQPTQSGSGLRSRTSSSPFPSTETTSKAKKTHGGPLNFDAILEVGTQFLDSGTGRNTLAYKPGLCPYDTNIPPTYAEIMPKGFLEAFQSTKFEWGNVPECVPPIQLR
ncbi:hypothetical protein M378DRAFT_12511 [Amanita muscaria Koide BX008]|uniref:Uncharacterized protein n=1 Tax=Amanita muscaria (strain Koide BX008) TaxID=946122 RepID=A0A0C2WN58_AMAMK|nr:hypothetical protein M378DRAFT_12511 [Amanita muscaria Koide BX008]